MKRGDGQRASKSGDDDRRHEHQQSPVHEQVQRRHRLASHRLDGRRAAGGSARPDHAVAVGTLTVVERRGRLPAQHRHRGGRRRGRPADVA